jgi:hypothetical protein
MPGRAALIFVIVFKSMAGKPVVCRNSQQKCDWREAEQSRLLRVQTLGQRFHVIASEAKQTQPRIMRKRREIASLRSQ